MRQFDRIVCKEIPRIGAWRYSQNEVRGKNRQKVLWDANFVLREVSNVRRVTHDNGLRVVIVRDPLSSALTADQNYLARGKETPDGFPGMAHVVRMASREAYSPGHKSTCRSTNPCEL